MAKRPPAALLEFADKDADWLLTPSPFKELDEEWIELIIFFVFHIPVKDVSARGKDLSEFGWGEKSDRNDYKVLKSRLIEFAQMNQDEFKCVDNWIDMRCALVENNLINFPLEIERQRVSFRKTKNGICESLLCHIRNAFAHGRLAFFDQNGETQIVMEDVDDKMTITARFVLSKTILKSWKHIIEAGPCISIEELRAELSLGHAETVE